MKFAIENLQIALVILTSLLLPLAIFVGRRNVRLRRLRALDTLSKTLRVAPPALVLARARYTDEWGGTARERASAWLGEIGVYALPTLIFVMVSAGGFVLLIGLGGLDFLLRGLPAEPWRPADALAATALVTGAGFVGAYVWSVEYLILRVANFDLSPVSFLRTSLHILTTVFVAWVLRQVAMTAPAGGETIAVTAVLGIAFLSGLYPSLGVRVLIERLPSWLQLKRDVPKAREIGRSFPLDLIDGIDPSVRFRLNQLEIADVQNLATANPIILYVESPYGLLQVMDWIAQAQLLAELGPDGFLEARALGVRDMSAFLHLGADAAGRGVVRSLLNRVEGADDKVIQRQFDAIREELHVKNFAHWQEILSLICEHHTDQRQGFLGLKAAK